MINKNRKRKIFECSILTKNRKGFLLTEEVLKIVVAVIGLVILAYFLIAIFYSNYEGKKEIEASSSIERISEAVLSLNSTLEKSVEGVRPQGWFVFSFVGDDVKPNSCLGGDCVCICDEVYFSDYFDRQVKECSDSGSCTGVQNLQSFEKIEIKSYVDGLTSLGIKKDDSGKIVIRSLR